MPYKGKKIDLSVLSSTILFEIITRHNPFRNAPLTGAINDILSGKKLNLKAFCREYPERVDAALARSSGTIARFSDIIAKGTCSDISRTYRSAAELRHDIESIGMNVAGKKFGAEEIGKTMKTFFGVTLGEDFLLTLANLENEFRAQTLSDDPDNIQRIVLLYKLRRSDRFNEFVKTLQSRAMQLAGAGSKNGREPAFLLRLFGKLHQFSMDRHHLAAAEALQ
jgi:hypothetical protein